MQTHATRPSHVFDSLPHPTLNHSNFSLFQNLRKYSREFYQRTLHALITLTHYYPMRASYVYWSLFSALRSARTVTPPLFKLHASRALNRPRRGGACANPGWRSADALPPAVDTCDVIGGVRNVAENVAMATTSHHHTLRHALT